MTQNSQPQIQQLVIHTDGGARGNPGPAATGFIITNQDHQTLHQAGRVIGSTTNNVAEYQAVIDALTWIQDHPTFQHLKVNFYLDSNLVVNQLNGKFKVTKPHLRELLLKVRGLETSLSLSTTYTYVPREQNSEADALVNLALDQQLL